ncbi:hypothetical protein GGS24DRAFT_492270 [Hypoxylon argillaceum]|nr:hypothetical protein GGS24DRAFT_492270 [Hypoxylon argillaceum]
MAMAHKSNNLIACLNEYSAGIQVIVCGLPRTGTTSIKLALEQLGYPKVYHMSTFVDHTGDCKYWEQVIKAKICGHSLPRSVWDNLLGNYQAVVDAPSCYFSTELAEAYPNAKVIILNRDSEKWYDSFAKTVQAMIKRRESLGLSEWILRPFLPTQVSAIIRIGNLLSKSGVGLGSYNKEECLKFFHKYYADCRARITAERCINFKVQDGWSPLCEHLGVCMPGQQTVDGWVQAPFPQSNDTESFHSWVARIQYGMLKQTWRNLVLHGVLLLGVVVLLRQATWFTSLFSYTRDSR